MGAATTSVLLAAEGCKPADRPGVAGGGPAEAYPFEGTRTPQELRRDARQHAVALFQPSERKTLDALADLILPADADGPAASVTGTTAFIEFMANDVPDFQTPLLAGLGWLSSACRSRFGNNDFTALDPSQQSALLDEIAYLPADPKEELTGPVAWFDLLRKLVLTGYF
ncbi:MAG: gluconate 2-dehydrogenase subunit 3 family protein, partial [Lewinella sp.]|nr:gluconate 2-dehydrogenase subunit 3 family protein [Lewinella sp.]